MPHTLYRGVPGGRSLRADDKCRTPFLSPARHSLLVEGKALDRLGVTFQEASDLLEAREMGGRGG